MPQPIPPEYGSITPYLMVPSGHEAISLYGRVFGATEHLKLTTPDGRQVLHAEVKIGDSIVMLADITPDMQVPEISADQWPPISIMLYVEDVDAVYTRAVEAGFTCELEPTDMFYGDRTAKVRDPYGHRWAVSTHVEDVPQEEVERRARQMFDV
jgi:PhnB protein